MSGETRSLSRSFSLLQTKTIIKDPLFLSAVKLLPPYLGDAASLLQPFLIHTLTSTAAAALSLLP